MKTLTVCAGFATALLAGCGGSQVAPTGGTIAGAASAAHGKSWMLPEAKREDLIYAVGGCGGTCVLSYPEGKVVGELADVDGGADDPNRNLRYAVYSASGLLGGP